MISVVSKNKNQKQRTKKMSESQKHNPDHEDVDAGRIHDKDEAEFVAYAVKKREESIQELGNSLLRSVEEEERYHDAQVRWLVNLGVLDNEKVTLADRQKIQDHYNGHLIDERNDANTVIDQASKTYKIVKAAKSGKAITDPDKV
jgi:hypothetical protein